MVSAGPKARAKRKTRSKVPKRVKKKPKRIAKVKARPKRVKPKGKFKPEKTAVKAAMALALGLDELVKNPNKGWKKLQAWG